MNKTLRKILIIAGGALAAVVVLVLVLPFVVPMDAYRGRIENAAGAATGRALKIEGPLRLTLFPHLGIKAEAVTLANLPGGRAAAMVDVGDISLSLKLVPLLTGHIALEKIILDKPTIALEVDADGNPNWKFGKASPKTGGKKGTLTLPSSTEFSGIDITDGKVTYDNAKTHTHRALEHVSVAIAITHSDAPIPAIGHLDTAGKRVDFAAHLATLKTFLGSGTTTFDAVADAELMHARLKGQIDTDGVTTGDFAFNTPSLRNLSAWLAEPLPAGGLNALTLAGKLRNKDKITDISDLDATLDGQNLKGTLAIDARAKVPVLGGTLAIDHLDLNPYLLGGVKHVTKVKEPGWNKDPISLALLKRFDGRLSLATGALHVRNVHMGRAALEIDNQGGLMKVLLKEVSLYGGTGHAELTVDARGAVPQFADVLDLKGVQLKPLLTDTMQIDSIEGTASASLDIRSAGNTTDAVMHSLTGKGTIVAADGRFHGVDLGRVAKSFKLLVGDGPVGATEFKNMGASFTLDRGVAATKDFQLRSPVVQIDGNGAVDLGGRTIDMHLTPQAAGIGVPFHVKGSWDKLKFAPDFGGMLQSGGTAINNLLGGGDKKNSVGQTLKDIFRIH